MRLLLTCRVMQVPPLWLLQGAELPPQPAPSAVAVSTQSKWIALRIRSESPVVRWARSTRSRRRRR